MTLKQKAVKGVVWSVIQSWGRQAIAFVVFSFLARLLNPEAFGLVALASVFLAFIQIFLDQGLSTAIIQRQKLEPEHLDTAFWVQVSIGVGMTIMSVIGAALIANLFNEPRLTPIIRWLSLSFLITAFSATQEAIFKRNLAFKALAVRSLVAVIAGGIVGLGMAVAGMGVWSLVGQQLTNGLAQVLVLWWASDWRPSFNVSKRHFRELFSFGANVVGINFLDFLNRRSDDLLIGLFLGPTALGYYTIAYRLLLITTDLLTSVTVQVAMPIFAKLQQEPERIRNAFYKVTQLTSLISFPVFLGLVVLAPELITTLFGSQWLPSIPVMEILSFIGIVHSVTYFNGTVMMAMGKPSWKLRLNAMHAVANVILFAATVHFGIVAVAAAYVIRSYLLSSVDLWVVKKLIHINLVKYFSQYASSMVASLLMVTIILAAKAFLGSLLNSYILLSLYTLIGATVYIVTISRIDPKQIQQIVDLANIAVPLKMLKRKP